MILVCGDLAADQRLLEDVHRLQEQRPLDPEARDQLGQPRIAREPREHRVEIVERVADLVDRSLDRLAQRAVRGERVLLEEAPDRVSRAEEVVVGRAGLLVGREHRDGLGAKRVHQLIGARDQRVTCGGVDEPLEDEEAVALVVVSRVHRDSVRSDAVP